MAEIQHADSIKGLDLLRKRILADPAAQMTYSELCLGLGRDPTGNARYIGQITSRIDAACFYADLPFLAMDKVRATQGGSVNEKSIAGSLWDPHRAQLAQMSSTHVWTAEDFRKVEVRLRDLGDDSAKAIWQRIGTHGEKAVRRALAARSASS